MTSDQTFILVAVAVVGFSLWFDHHRAHRARTMLRDWMQENGFQLTSTVRRWVPPLSLFFRTSRYQLVFRVEARDREGRLHTGFAVCGGWLLGLFSERVEMRWDESA